MIFFLDTLVEIWGWFVSAIAALVAIVFLGACCGAFFGAAYLVAHWLIHL